MCLLLQDYLKPNLKSNNRFPMSEFSGDFCISIISSVQSVIIDPEQHYFLCTQCHYWFRTALFPLYRVSLLIQNSIISSVHECHYWFRTALFPLYTVSLLIQNSIISTFLCLPLYSTEFYIMLVSCFLGSLWRNRKMADVIKFLVFVISVVNDSD